MYLDCTKVATLLLNSVCYVDALTIPVPISTYNVSTTSLELVNSAMQDPFAPANGSRRIMVSGFFPAGNGANGIPEFSAYMPAATAQFYDQAYASYGIPNGTFESLQMDLYQKNASHTKGKCAKLPVVIFSPGLGNSRLLYSTIAASLASQGFAVVTIDHAYDASIVEFPDGSVILASNITTDQQIEFALNVRVEDILFLADQLHNHTVMRALFTDLDGSLSIKQLFVAGHSLGGATAASVIANSPIFKSGINLDGTFFGPVIEQGLTAPFMMMAHEGKNLTTDPSWEQLWPNMKGTKLLAGVNGTVHASFTDLPLLAETLGLTQSLPAGSVDQLVGSVPGQHMVGLTSTCMQLFFNYVRRKIRGEAFQQLITQDQGVKIINATVLT